MDYVIKSFRIYYFIIIEPSLHFSLVTKTFALMVSLLFSNNKITNILINLVTQNFFSFLCAYFAIEIITLLIILVNNGRN